MALREVDGGPGYFAQFVNSLPTDPSYFPIGVWFESVITQADINLDKDVGLNLYVVLTASSNLSLIQNNGMHAILQADTDEWRTSQAAINNPAVVGWLTSDEIDMEEGNAAGAARARAVLDSLRPTLPVDGRFRYTNYGKGVLEWLDDDDAEKFVNDYQQVTSADHYWFTDPYSGAPGRLAANYGYDVDRMRELDAMDGQRQPIWAFVEVGWPFTQMAAEGGRAIEPEEIRAAVWHSIIAGARGIIYFNHSFGGPDQTQHALRDPEYAAQRAAVTETNALIEQLASVLNAPFDDAFVTASPSVRVMAHFSEGWHYVFAASTQHDASAATFTLPSVTSGTATVINEGRTISITGGQFVDNFANGNAFHIYQINMGGTPGHDSLVGTDGPDTIVALAGDDIVDGRGARDLLFGNQDNDTVLGGTGNDTIWGGQGNDSLDGAEDNDFLWGNQGQDTIGGGDGTNTIVGGQDSSDAADSITAGSGPDLIWGNGGADTITADGGGNTVIGGFGSDSIVTGSADDIIFGNEDSDTISGGDGANLIFGGFGDDSITGSGNDTVWGNEGNDTIAAGVGADRYVFLIGSGNDKINGFVFGEGDRLDLQGQTFTQGTSSDGDVLLTLFGGGTVELNGITPAGFSPTFVL